MDIWHAAKSATKGTAYQKNPMAQNLLDRRIKEKLEELQKSIEANAPAHIKKLGKILRRRSVFSLRRFLVDNGYAGKIGLADLPLFMDYLITQRIDMKDMHDEARSRLRIQTLLNQPKEAKTSDYVKYIEESIEPMYCKNCQWFMEPPPGEEESCIKAGGSKGCDEPCYGFTKKRLP